MIKLVVQLDDLCIDFWVSVMINDHLSQRPDNRKTWYSNVLTMTPIDPIKIKSEYLLECVTTILLPTELTFWSLVDVVCSLDV